MASQRYYQTRTISKGISTLLSNENDLQRSFVVLSSCIDALDFLNMAIHIRRPGSKTADSTSYTSGVFSSSQGSIPPAYVSSSDVRLDSSAPSSPIGAPSSIEDLASTKPPTPRSTSALAGAPNDPSEKVETTVAEAAPSDSEELTCEGSVLIRRKCFRYLYSIFADLFLLFIFIITTCCTR